MLTTTQSGQNGPSSPHTHWKPRGVNSRLGPLPGENRSDILVRMRLVLFSLLILLVPLGAGSRPDIRARSGQPSLAYT